MSMLEQAIALATAAHSGEVDKAGAPYILHPLRVMLAMQSDKQRIVAVLHDVVEDCGVSLKWLRQMGFSKKVVRAVDALTRREDEKDDYEAFVRRAARNRTARAVKLADLRDNLDISRIPHPTAADRMRCLKYERAVALIRSLERNPTV